MTSRCCSEIRCRVRLDGKADDGRSGERDDLRVENVFTPSSIYDDGVEATPTWSPGPHDLSGDAGPIS